MGSHLERREDRRLHRRRKLLDSEWERFDVLAAFEALADRENLIVRKTGVDGADWTDVQVRVKRKGDPAVVYANVEPGDAKRNSRRKASEQDHWRRR